MASKSKKAAAKKAPARSKAAAVALPVKKKASGGKGLMIAAIMIAAVGLIGVQIYFKARKEASLKFDMQLVGHRIAQGMSDGQGMSPQNLQGDKDDNLFFLDGQGTDPGRLQKFSPSNDFIAKYVPKKASEMITNPADIDVDKDGNPWILLRSGDIQVLDKNLKFQRSISTRVSGPTGFGLLPDGRFVVASQNDNKIVVFSAAGVKLSEFGSPGTKTGDVTSPVRLRTTLSGMIVIMETVTPGLHAKVFSPDFKLLTQFNLDKLPWCEPVKLGVTNDDKMFCNDHLGGTGLKIWRLKNGEYLGTSPGTTDQQFFISPGSSGANKYTRSVYVHSINGLTKCLMPEGK